MAEVVEQVAVEVKEVRAKEKEKIKGKIIPEARLHLVETIKIRIKERLPEVSHHLGSQIDLHAISF